MEQQKLEAKTKNIQKIQEKLRARDEAIYIKNQPQLGQKQVLPNDRNPSNPSMPAPMPNIGSPGPREGSERGAAPSPQDPMMGGRNASPMGGMVKAYAKGGYVNQGIGASKKPHNVFGSKGKK